MTPEGTKGGVSSPGKEIMKPYLHREIKNISVSAWIHRLFGMKFGHFIVKVFKNINGFDWEKK